MESSDGTTEQLMFSLIEVWKSSGKSQKEFCREKDIAYHKFHYWFKKYSEQDSGSLSNSPFRQIAVKHPQAKTSTGVVEIVYPDGRKLILHQPVEATFLRSLLG